MVQLSHWYMTIGKAIALTRRTFVGKVMSLLFNMLSRLVIAYLPSCKRLLILWLQSPSAVVLEPKKIKSVIVSNVSPPICHEVMGISELKWTRMGEFNSNDHCIYYCGQESLRRNGVTITVNKSPKCSIWMQFQKWQNDLCSFLRQTIQYHSNPSLCPDSNPEEAEAEWFYEYLQDPLELTP